jgi:hypothetical protein
VAGHFDLNQIHVAIFLHVSGGQLQESHNEKGQCRWSDAARSRNFKRIAGFA